MLLKGQEQRTTTTFEFLEKCVQLLQNEAIVDAKLGYHVAISRISGTKTPFGVVQDCMESLPCKEGAC